MIALLIKGPNLRLIYFISKEILQIYHVWHVKRSIIRYFHIIILSYLFVFKKIYISVLSEFITIVYFSIYIQYPFISTAYFPFIFYILSFVFYNFHYYFIFFYFYYIFQHLYSMFGRLYLLTSYYYFISLYFYFITGAYLYSISFPFLFYTLTYLYCILCLFTFVQAISLAKLSRSSSSLDRLTSDRTNTKTDRL